MTMVCNLCMLNCSPLTVETMDLRLIVDKIFYFEIFRSKNHPSFVCNACKEKVEAFSNYAENVLKNQQFLRDDALTSSGNVLKFEHMTQENREDKILESTTSVEVKNEVAYYVVEEIPLDIKTEFIEPVSSGDRESETDSNESYSLVKEPANDNVVIDNSLPKDRVKKTANCKKAALEKELLKHYQLNCDLCSEPLASFAELMMHFRRIHNQMGYIRCCNKKIQRRYWMIEHMQVHLNPDTFNCTTCKKSYSSSRVLKEHIKEVHTPFEERAIKCGTCRKPFATQRALSSHLLAAHGSVPCPQCSKLLASQGSLKKHMLMMHGEGEQYICDTCAKVFRSKPCFDKHVKIHEGTFEEKRVQCDLCLAWLTDKYCLRKHMRRSHSSQDEVVNCEECGCTQRNKIMLKMHMTRAHGESRFECEICFKKFKRSYHMKEHKAIHHTGEKLYSCDYCPERFNKKNKHYLHRKKHHPNEYQEEMSRRMGTSRSLSK